MSSCVGPPWLVCDCCENVTIALTVARARCTADCGVASVAVIVNVGSLGIGTAEIRDATEPGDSPTALAAGTATCWLVTSRL